MIERDIVEQKIREFEIKEFVADKVRRSGHSDTVVKRTPLGEKIIVYASRPGLVVGRQGQNIRELTQDLKDKFGLENPQIEVGEVENIYLDANIVADMIAMSLERFGSQRFKAVMHRTMDNVMRYGALGVEIVLSGKLPSSRARSWRVYTGYLKKCGEISISGVKKAKAVAELKSGVIGVKVSIMPPDIKLPDRVDVLSEEMIREDSMEEEKQEKKNKSKKKKKQKSKKKKSSKSKSKKDKKEQTDKQPKSEKESKSPDNDPKEEKKEQKEKKPKSENDKSEEK
ncbi:MAG: 30S ribosomal protein S3 [Candidatus Woesearchaeota archaeon]|nr:30S ribosomal protein S3 [Candidatus Woesearchaeota archaeon]